MWPSWSGIRRSLLLSLLLAAVLSLLAPGSAQASSGDDYPTAYRTQTNVNAVDKWGFTQRQCVSFVAWRLQEAGRPLSNSGNTWGSAYNWDTAAARLGKRVTRTPRVGAIAQWNAGERSPLYYRSSTPNGSVTAGQYGHVAYVRAVYSDGSVLVEQYNISGNRSYSTMRLKAPRYLYL